MISIKDICTVLNVTPTTIRLYEKYLPEVPWYVGENGYRGFYFENLTHLFNCRSVAKYGASLRESFDGSIGGCWEAEDDILAKQREVLARQARMTNDLIESLDETRLLMGKIPVLQGSFEEVSLPAFLHLDFGSHLTDLSQDTRDIVSNWAQAIPFVHFTPYYQIERIGDEADSEAMPARSGFSIALSYAHMVDTSHPFVLFRPASRALATIFSVNGVAHPPGSSSFAGGLPFDEPRYKMTRALFEEGLRERGLKLTGNIYTRLIYSAYPGKYRSDGKESNAIDYFYAWTPLN